MPPLAEPPTENECTALLPSEKQCLELRILSWFQTHSSAYNREGRLCFLHGSEESVKPSVEERH